MAPEDRYYYASQRELIWWRFTRHKVALGATVLLILLYLGAIFADFVSPYTKDTRFEGMQSMPPTTLHLIKPDGGIQLYIYGMTKKLDQKTFKYTYTEDPSQIYPVQFFFRGEPYEMLGFIQNRPPPVRRQMGTPIFVFGSDRSSATCSPERGPARAFLVDRPGRCVHHLHAGGDPGRHLGVLWRHRG